MLNPVSYPLTCYVGGTWDQEFQFWDDTSGTVAHDFTGWTLVMTITLPGVGAVLPTIEVSGNSVLVSMPASVTSTFTDGTVGHWILKMQDTATPANVEFLMHGTFTVSAP